jgi:hypothetical protein
MDQCGLHTCIVNERVKLGVYVRQFRLMIPITLAVIWSCFVGLSLDIIFFSRAVTFCSISPVALSMSAFSVCVTSPSSTIVSVCPRHSDSGRI